MSIVRLRSEFRIVAIYVILAGVWIIGSDLFLDALLGKSPDTLQFFRTFKGLFFVIATAPPLYWALHREISAREKAQEELRNLNLDLEHKITARTEELSAMREEMLHLARVKSRFINDIIHSLRTPITSINLRLELLDKLPHEEYPRHMDGLKRQTEQLNALIVGVLDLVYLEEQGLEREQSAVNLNIVALQIVEAHQDIAQDADLKLVFYPAENLPLVMGGSNHLGQMIANLMTNAIKYTAVGQVTLTTLFDDVRNMVRMEIKDTGMGIDPEDLPRLFDRFFRSKRAAKSGIPGTGLGLGIVREVLDLYGGDIEVKSKIGEGTTFILWLPPAEPHQRNKP